MEYYPVRRPDNMRRAAKVGHRKSRNGCQKCKARRVKCDEARPLCGSCLRLGLDCSWPDTSTSTLNGTPAASPPSHVSPGAISSNSAIVGEPGGPGATGSYPGRAQEDAHRFSVILDLWSGSSGKSVDDQLASASAAGRSSAQASEAGQLLDGDGDGDGEDDAEDQLPESRARRLLEHRLMQNWLFNLTMPFPVAPSQDWTDMWAKKVPAMALKYENLLYAVLACSATHLLRDEPGNPDLFHVRQTYLISSMRAQRRRVDAMARSLTVESADAVCFTSLIILTNAFAMLHERVLEPYEPPVEWMRLGKGAGTVMWTSVQAMLELGEANAANSLMLSTANSPPKFGTDESYFDRSMRQEFESILAQALPSGDVWDAETRETYEKTLSYVGSIQKSITRGEPVYVVCRRIQGFAFVTPPRFIDFVAEQRPRALVILAHYFATVSQVSRVWWLSCDQEGVESTAKREIRAIKQTLPPEWQGHMIWPLDIARLL